MHVDIHLGKYIIYSIPNSRVHELRGKEVVIYCDEEQNNNVATALAALARENSVLGIALTQYSLPIYLILTCYSPIIHLLFTPQM